MKTIIRILLFSASLLTCHHGLCNRIGDDILLIINYNFEHYDSVPFLVELYKPYFPHIVFYGPRGTDQVNFCDHFKGCYSYKGIIDALQRYPGYAGYLWVHDDAVINPWMLDRFDKTKIWAPQLGFTDQPFNGIASLKDPHSTSWCWWPMGSGYEMLLRTYERWDIKYKKILAQNLGPDNAAYGYSDILYLPVKYAQDFITLASNCQQGSQWDQNLFLEIALPTIIFCLAPKDDIERLNGIQLWDGKKNMATTYYTRQLDYLHPFKWSNLHLRKYIKQQ